jgi:hypothetical protein
MNRSQSNPEGNLLTREEKAPERQEFYIYLRGGWRFDYTTWAGSAEEALNQAKTDLEADHGPIDLSFGQVEVFDEGEKDLLLTWKEGE